MSIDLGITISIPSLIVALNIIRLARELFLTMWSKSRLSLYCIFLSEIWHVVLVKIMAKLPIHILLLWEHKSERNILTEFRVNNLEINMGRYLPKVSLRVKSGKLKIDFSYKHLTKVV